MPHPALGALSIVGASVGALPAGAASTAAVPSPANKLLSASAAKALGYPKVAEKPQSTSKTQQAGCPKAAQVAYEDSAGKTAVIPEILTCNSTEECGSRADHGAKVRHPNYGADAAEGPGIQHVRSVYWAVDLCDCLAAG